MRFTCLNNVASRKGSALDKSPFPRIHSKSHSKSFRLNESRYKSGSSPQQKTAVKKRKNRTKQKKTHTHTHQQASEPSDSATSLNSPGITPSTRLARYRPLPLPHPRLAIATAATTATCSSSTRSSTLLCQRRAPTPAGTRTAPATETTATAALAGSAGVENGSFVNARWVLLVVSGGGCGG